MRDSLATQTTKALGKFRVYSNDLKPMMLNSIKCNELCLFEINLRQAQLFKERNNQQEEESRGKCYCSVGLLFEIFLPSTVNLRLPLNRKRKKSESNMMKKVMEKTLFWINTLWGRNSDRKFHFMCSFSQVTVPGCREAQPPFCFME